MKSQVLLIGDWLSDLLSVSVWKFPQVQQEPRRRRLNPGAHALHREGEGAPTLLLVH